MKSEQNKEITMLDTEYPKWLYHATEKPILLFSKLDEDELGPGWKDTPAAFFETKSEVKKSEDKKIEHRHSKRSEAKS